MIETAADLVRALEQGASQFGLGPQARILVREGEFGPERLLEHVKIREGRFGLEIVLQSTVRPLDG